MQPKIAEFWISEKGGVKCTLCPHSCFLQKDEIGICRTRKNINGNLISLVYGYPCALHVDPIEKKPLYHFLPGSKSLSTSTTGCNLRCLNCQNHHISQASFVQDEFKFLSPEQLVGQAKKHKCKSISYTYTDPVVYYEYAKDTAILAKEAGLRNIIVSAGYINKKPIRELTKYIDAANIDLKCFDEKLYKSLSQVSLKPVLQTIELLKEENIWLEITNLVIPEYSDDLKMIKNMCKWLVSSNMADVPLHFSRFYPTYQLNHLYPTPIEVLNSAYKIAKEVGISYVYIGNVSQEKTNQTYCKNCHQMIIERSGFLVSDFKLNNGLCTKCGNEIAGVWS